VASVALGYHRHKTGVGHDLSRGCPTRTLKLTWPSLRSGPRSLMPDVSLTQKSAVGAVWRRSGTNCGANISMKSVGFGWCYSCLVLAMSERVCRNRASLSRLEAFAEPEVIASSHAQFSVWISLKRALLLGTTVLVATIGCSSGAAEGGSRGGDAVSGTDDRSDHVSVASGTVSSWVTDLTAAYCSWATRCGKFRDSATCSALMSPQFGVVNFNQAPAAITSVSNETARFNPAQASSCLMALSNLDCDIDLLDPSATPESCSIVFSGSVSSGGACINDVECAQGAMCIVTSTMACAGVCTPVSSGNCRTDDDCLGQRYCASVLMQGSGLDGSGVCEDVVPPGTSAGDPCGNPVQCASGLSCAGGPAPARCVLAAKAGERCGGFGGPSCNAGLACVPSDDGATSTCMVPASLGEPCTSLFQCGAQFELSDIICDERDTQTCVYRPRTGSCVVSNGLNTCDPVTGYCDGSTNGGTCNPWLEQGAECPDLTVNGIGPCGLWNTCQNGVCVPVLGVCTPE
jgi:hypothetical protein